MSKIKRFFKGKSLLRNIIVGILIVVTVGAAVGGIVALSRNTDKIDEALTYESIGWTKYKIGGLAPSNGAYMNTDQSIYTEKAFECQGLNVTPVFDSDVSYQIYFYDQNNEFVHTTGLLTGTFVQESVPFFAKFARIVVTPNNDNKVTIFEKAKYAKQIEVKVYREQGYKNYTEDLFEAVHLHSKINSSGEIVSDETTNCVSDYINISQYKEALVFRTSGNTDISGNKIHFYSLDKTFINYLTIGDMATNYFTTSQGYNYYSVPLNGLPLDSVPTFVLISCGPSTPIHFCCK